MVDNVKEVLNSLDKSTKYVLPSSNSKQINRMPKQWQNIVDDLIENNTNAGKHKITPHSLRHTHASWMAQNSVDILQIKEQLGHKRIDMTLRYSHLISSHRHEKTKELYEKFQKSL